MWPWPTATPSRGPRRSGAPWPTRKAAWATAAGCWSAPRGPRPWSGSWSRPRRRRRPGHAPTAWPPWSPPSWAEAGPLAAPSTPGRRSTFAGNWYGAYLRGCRNLRIEDSVFAGNAGHGLVVFQGSNDVTLAGNEVHDNRLSGIDV